MVPAPFSCIHKLGRRVVRGIALQQIANLSWVVIVGSRHKMLDSSRKCDASSLSFNVP